MKKHALQVKEEILGFVEKVYISHTDLKRNFYMSIENRGNEGIHSVENENGISVVASTHSSTWHPHCVYVCLAYDIDCTDQNALHSMIELLRGIYEKPLFFLIDNRLKRFAELLTQKDFNLIRKTEVLNISPEKSNIDTDFRERELKTVSEIIENPIYLSSFIEICKKTYTATHLANPVADMANLEWENVIFADLLHENSYVFLKGNEVIAFSLMYESGKNRWELGWIGVADGVEMCLLDFILENQLHDAYKQKIEFIEKEVDSTCPYSLHIVQSLRYEIAETFFAFLEEKS